MSQLLGGRMGDSVVTSCGVGTGVVTASAQAVFVSWTPFTPDFVIEMTAQATRELPPCERSWTLLWSWDWRSESSSSPWHSLSWHSGLGLSAGCSLRRRLPKQCAPL